MSNPKVAGVPVLGLQSSSRQPTTPPRPATAMPSGPPSLDAWLDRFFASYHAHRPVNATFIGLHDQDHRLPDLSANGVGDTVADMSALLSEADGLDEENRSPHGSMDKRLAEGFLKIQLWEHGSDHFHRGNPSLYTGEAVFGVMSLFLTDFAPVEQRTDAAICRMESIPAFLAQGRANVRRAPFAWTDRAIRECGGAAAFFSEGVAHLAVASGSDARAFEKSAGRAARAFEEFRSYLQQDLVRHGSEGYACGEEAWSLYLREGHFISLDADHLLAYAEEQLDEADGFLRERAADFGAASPHEALAGLTSLHPPVEGYYPRYQKIWDDVRELAEANDLVTWPDFPIRYVPRPTWTRAAAPSLYFLYYRSPAAYNRPAVHDYLVTPVEPTMPVPEQRALLQASNDSVIKLNHVIHHGSIGHHVQNWYAFRSPSRVGRIAAVDCASRIAMFCGGTMAEGWACYATDLIGEFGGLTPLEEYAERHARVRMACRAIVDIELHRGRLTLDRAEELYRRRAGMSPAGARTEAVKNSMFPGSAVMYLMGTDAIHRLRTEMSGIQGSGFSLRAFHDQLLSYGSVPVSLVAADMKRMATHGG